jgi:hypothetical protein
MSKKLDYSKRTFNQIKDELYGFIKHYYPEVHTDFEDSSVGAMLVDVCAAVGDMLSFNTDRAFQETQLGQAQLKRNLLEIAKTMGVKLPHKRAAVSICEFTVSVPVAGGTFDSSYLPILKAGAQVTGNGKVFETAVDIDFSSPFSSFGTINRIITPIHDTLNRIVRYEITKKEVVYNGVTRIFKQIIGDGDIKPFMELTLLDPSVLNILSVIAIDGVHGGFPDDSEFHTSENRYYEVNNLAENKLFLEKGGDSSQVKAGEWVKVTRKFTKEFTEKGYCKLTFGGGNGDLESFTDAIRRESSFENLEKYILNSALGETLKPNTTVYVKYRVGGGPDSNIGRNVLTNIGTHSIEVPDGINGVVSDAVKKSLTVNNPIPGFGGRDGYSIEELRNIISANYASQGRAVTLKDYLAKVYEMDGRYGSPFKATAFKENNKVVISILGMGDDGKLDNTSSRLLRDNIGNWLSGMRSQNDYVEIRNGQIVNLGYDIEVYGEDHVSSTEIVTKVISEVTNYHDVYKRQMNEDIFLGNLIEKVNNVPGVLNVLSYKVYNKQSGNYSPNKVSMDIEDDKTGEIKLVNNTIYSGKDSMFEIKYPNRDIRVTVKKSSQL